MIHLLLNLFGIVIVALTAPLILELAVLTPAAYLFALRHRRTAPTPHLESPAPALILLIPAHNEEQLIARTIQSLQAASANALAPVRICVIAHNCTDATATNAHKAAEAFPNTSVLELNNPNLPGKGNALLYGFTTQAPPASLATKTAFVVIDADTIVAPDLLQLIQQSIASGAEALQCRYEALTYTASGAQKASLAALAFRAFNTVRARGRAQLGLSCGIFGNGFALRADLLTRVPYNAHSVVEDLEYHIALLRSGIKVCYLDHARLNGEIIGSRSQKSRWDGGRARMARQWLPSLIADILRGRLRMIGPALYLASLPLAQGVLLLLIALILPLPWLKITATASLSIVLLHVLVAIDAGPSPAADFKLFLRLPLYFFAKIAALPATLKMSRTNAAWVRTQRDTETTAPPDAD